MKKYITISPEIRKHLVEKYKISDVSIWKALCFITKNKRSQEIRQDALAMGGRYLEEDFVPNCRTEHRDGTIIQTFAGGVQVSIDAGSTKIIVDESIVESFKDVTIESWGNVLAKAQEISQNRVFNN
ncbi:MAG: hypothetical protein ACTTGW_01375 [Candidatus Cryptobacteroides sp.]